MPLQSAGILLYRPGKDETEVLLVHPGGPYFAGKDRGVWSIPKGLVTENEDFLQAAKREFAEELGLPLTATEFVALAPIRQKGGKTVHAWAVAGYLNADAISSNVFQMEFPYKSGRWIEVPEVDRAAWYPLSIAADKILPAQKPFLEELARFLAGKQ